MTYLLAVAAGLAAGAFFAALRLPVPAPPTIPGVLGIVGLWAGYTLVRTFLGAT